MPGLTTTRSPVFHAARAGAERVDLADDVRAEAMRVLELEVR